MLMIITHCSFLHQLEMVLGCLGDHRQQCLSIKAAVSRFECLSTDLGGYAGRADSLCASMLEGGRTA